MNKGLAAFNRIVAFLGFLLFAAVGALLIALHFNNPVSYTHLTLPTSDLV